MSKIIKDIARQQEKQLDNEGQKITAKIALVICAIFFLLIAFAVFLKNQTENDLCLRRAKSSKYGAKAEKKCDIVKKGNQKGVFYGEKNQKQDI